MKRRKGDFTAYAAPPAQFFLVDNHRPAVRSPAFLCSTRFVRPRTPPLPACPGSLAPDRAGLGGFSKATLISLCSAGWVGGAEIQAEQDKRDLALTITDAG